MAICESMIISMLQGVAWIAAAYILADLTSMYLCDNDFLKP